MKTIQLTAGQIFEAVEPFNKLLEQDLPIGTGYKLSKFAIDLKLIAEKIGEKRLKLFETYGEKKGETYEIKKENYSVFQERIKIVFEEMIDVAIPVITIDDLENVSLTPKELIALNWLITDDD